jgi:hypothetical protein
MIAEVDQALGELVREIPGVPKDVDVVFDAPTKDWAARRNAPTVNLYLYDIREDLRRRERGFIEGRNEQGIVVTRTPGPRFFKLSYLVTAWTQRPEDEHRLLDGLLQALLPFDALPAELMTGSLAETARPASVTVALPPPEDRAFADVWSSLGGELKPSLDVVVTVPMATGVVYQAGPPVTAGVEGQFTDLVGAGVAESRAHRLGEGGSA